MSGRHRAFFHRPGWPVWAALGLVIVGVAAVFWASEVAGLFRPTPPNVIILPDALRADRLRVTHSVLWMATPPIRRHTVAWLRADLSQTLALAERAAVGGREAGLDPAFEERLRQLGY